jgi:hypothetical protein
MDGDAMKIGEIIDNTAKPDALPRWEVFWDNPWFTIEKDGTEDEQFRSLPALMASLPEGFTYRSSLRPSFVVGQPVVGSESFPSCREFTGSLFVTAVKFVEGVSVPDYWRVTARPVEGLAMFEGAERFFEANHTQYCNCDTCKVSALQEQAWRQEV